MSSPLQHPAQLGKVPGHVEDPEFLAPGLRRASILLKIAPCATISPDSLRRIQPMGVLVMCI